MPPITWVIADAPISSPLAEFAVDGTSVCIGLTGLGRARVAAEGITIEAPSADMWPLVHDRLGAWALGQYLQRRGYRAVPGVCVARHGQCLLIVGAPRSGATFLGLALAVTGWNVVADAFVPVDHAGVAHPTDHPIRIDDVPGRAIFAGLDTWRTGSGRSRINVAAPRSPFPARVTHLLDLRASRQLAQAHLQRPDHLAAATTAGVDVPSLVPGSPASRPGLPVVDQRRLVRPDARDMTIARDHLPQRLATMLCQQWLDPTSGGVDT